jgi:hypothetical protein
MDRWSSRHRRWCWACLTTCGPSGSSISVLPGPDRGEGGKFVLVPPSYDGSAPGGRLLRWPLPHQPRGDVGRSFIQYDGPGSPRIPRRRSKLVGVDGCPAADRVSVPRLVMLRWVPGGMAKTVLRATVESWRQRVRSMCCTTCVVRPLQTSAGCRRRERRRRAGMHSLEAVPSRPPSVHLTSVRVVLIGQVRSGFVAAEATLMADAETMRP